jgi:SAM-dependent methyltransferase
LSIDTQRRSGHPSAGAKLAAALRAGCQVADGAIDALLPPSYRGVSGDYWTPVYTAMYAARWLCPDASARVLDVGSGVGKLCVIGSLVTGATFTGVEQRPHLVEVARQLAADVDARSALFICADAFALDWTAFDGFYFFNPFGEGDHPVQLRLDDTVAYPEDAHARTVARLTEKLESLRAGTRVVIYHSLGCDLPAGFQRAERSWQAESALELWVKR